MLTIHLVFPTYKSNVVNSYVTSFRALNSELNGTRYKNLTALDLTNGRFAQSPRKAFFFYILSFPRGFCGIFTQYVHRLNPSSIHLIHEISRCFVLRCQVSKPLDVSFCMLPEDLFQFTQVSSQKANMLIDTVLWLVWAYPLAFSTSISEK